MSRTSDNKKPYDFVPIAPLVKAQTVGHEQVRGERYNTGHLAYQIQTLSYLFVAGGSYRLADNAPPHGGNGVQHVQGSFLGRLEQLFGRHQFRIGKYLDSYLALAEFVGCLGKIFQQFHRKIAAGVGRLDL